jgi:CO/xanthine dehydrogenase FAD-binding subunit
MSGDRFERMHSLAEAVARASACSRDGVPFQLLAGGTDLLVEGHLAPPSKDPRPSRCWLDVSSVPELARVEDRGDTLRLGGGVTYLTLRKEPLAGRIPLLAAMAKDVGAVQIQARGTLAGNVATGSPAADGVCALFALDAVVGLASTAGERAIPIGEYYEGYKKTKRRADEVIAWIDVRVPAAGARWRWRKVGTRLAQAISKVALASVIELDGDEIRRARFGMGSVGPTTTALPSVRALVEGRRRAELDLDAVERAVDADVSPIDDVRSTAEYRRHVARAVVREWLREP